MDEQQKQNRKQAIVIGAAIFAARDLAKDWNGGRSKVRFTGGLRQLGSCAGHKLIHSQA